MRRIPVKKKTSHSPAHHTRQSFRVSMGLIFIMLGVLLVLNMIMMTHNADEAAAAEMHSVSPR